MTIRVSSVKYNAIQYDHWVKPSADTSMVETVAISGDIFRTESFVLKDKPVEQGPFAHCDDDEEVVITDEGKRFSDMPETGGAAV